MKKLLTVTLCLAMMFSLVACGGGDQQEQQVDANVSDQADANAPEQTVLKFGIGSGGAHVFNEIAREQGYLAEEGIDIENIIIEDASAAFSALSTGKVDFLASFGTNMPLQSIATGTDLTIFGGTMLTGCMPIVAPEGTVWNGVEDLVGKNVACGGPGDYYLSGPLMDLGYSVDDVNWITIPNQGDRVIAVQKGEADYAVVGTRQNWNVSQTEGVEAIAYASDVMPNYSCCRAEAMTDWVNSNPNTVKALLRCWIRAQEYYEDHKDDAVRITAAAGDIPEESVSIYVFNDHYQMHVDPIEDTIEKAWSYLDQVGVLDDNAKQIDITDHINKTLYKEALDECVEKYYDDDPEFYDAMLKFYEENNK